MDLFDLRLRFYNMWFIMDSKSFENVISKCSEMTHIKERKGNILCIQ